MVKEGTEFTFTPATNGIVHKRSNVQSKKERADSVRSSSSVSSEESVIDHIVDEECEDENNFWMFMYSLSDGYDEFLDLLKSYLLIYTQSKGDILFQKIKDETGELEATGMNFKQALAESIGNNKEAIKFKISDCSDIPSTEEIGIWCKFAKYQDDWNSCCKWIFKHDCRRNTCPTLGVPKVIAWFGYLLHLMNENDLIQNIAGIIENGVYGIVDSIILAVEEYKDDILERYDETADLLSNTLFCNKLHHQGLVDLL